MTPLSGTGQPVRGLEHIALITRYPVVRFPAMTMEPERRLKGRVLRCASDQLCLAFVNTVAWRKTKTPEERLPSPSALLDWWLGAGILDTADGERLNQRWDDHPREALALYRPAIELREAIYRIFRSRMLAEAPRAAELLVLNEVLAAVPPRVRIAPSGGRLGWWTGATRSGPLDLLAPIAWSAADLMTGARAERVRQCEDNKGCGWLFLDESRAGTRRWCSMGDCGNRAKARRHYLRSKQLETAGSGHEGDAERAEADLTGEQGE
jgi:predicted RNA-binding Zn ribbon-like protein